MLLLVARCLPVVSTKHLHSRMFFSSGWQVSYTQRCVCSCLYQWLSLDDTVALHVACALHMAASLAVTACITRCSMLPAAVIKKQQICLLPASILHVYTVLCQVSAEGSAAVHWQLCCAQPHMNPSYTWVLDGQPFWQQPFDYMAHGRLCKFSLVL
jgi:hypothetical protein